MTRGAEFVLDTAALFGRAESRFELRTEAKLADMELSDSKLKSTVVDGLLMLDLVLERTGSTVGADEVDPGDSQRPRTGGVLVTGIASGRWSVPCRRCLEPAQGDLVAEIEELFEANPTEGETWPLRDQSIDLGPMLREAALLCLPLAPLCGAQCEGPAPDRFPTGPADDQDSKIDSRWSVLDELTFDG